MKVTTTKEMFIMKKIVSLILASVLLLSAFSVVSFALTDLARHIDIAHKMHFNFNNAVTLTSFTSAALDIK